MKLQRLAARKSMTKWLIKSHDSEGRVKSTNKLFDEIAPGMLAVTAVTQESSEPAQDAVTVPRWQFLSLCNSRTVYNI